MNTKKLHIEERCENVARAWVPTEHGGQQAPHSLFCDGSFSKGENEIESVKENGGLNGHVSFDITLDGSPGTVVTQWLDVERDKAVIEHYRGV